MRKLALIVLVVLALPATAFAKGPSKAEIAGSGIATIKISGAEGSASPFWRLTEAAGWFEAAYGTPLLPEKPPSGDLGPRYTIIWTVPSSSKLHQDLYPYARPSPVTYMPRGQRIYGSPVKGGWFAGGAKLRRVLLRIGLPERPPVTSAPNGAKPASAPVRDRGFPTAPVVAVLLAAALLVVTGVATALRRRSSGAAGTSASSSPAAIRARRRASRRPSPRR